MLLYTPPKAADHLPQIDLGRSLSGDRAEMRIAAEAIHRACRETGFFYVSHHGVPATLVDEVFAVSQRFFSLPDAGKRALHMKASPSTMGYEPVGGQALDSQDDTAQKAPPDLKESFYCGLDLPNEHPLTQRGWRAYGHNQWPAALPEFRECLLRYHSAMSRLGDHVLALIALSLDLSPDWFAPFYDNAGGALRLIKYPPQPTSAAFNQIGAGAHTDWGGITILAQDDAGGLEVRNVDGEWLQAPPVAETFVINLGDLMARWTNGIYSSNLHRVKNNRSGRDRFSVPFFYSPRPDAIVEPIPTCVDAEHPRRFATCTAAEHMSEMFRRSYGFAA